MPDDFDHEVIDSPQVLFRHLYEAHGVVEALDLDPATAPLQFWLRRHSELERAGTRAPAQDRAAAAPVAGAATSPPTHRANGTTAGARTAGPGGVAAAGSGPRFRPFGDPLVEALAAALVGLGMEERRVRRGLSTFTSTDGRHGEDAVRAAFIAPMLQAVAAYLTGGPPNVSQRPPPPPTAPRAARTGPPTRMPSGREPTAREPVLEPTPREPTPREPAAVRAGPPAAEHATSVARPPAARSSGPEPDADYMAIADVLQERRRSRRGGRRDGPALPVTTPPPPNPSASSPSATRPPAREPDDDFMALADALQRRRRTAPR